MKYVLIHNNYTILLFAEVEVIRERSFEVEIILKKIIIDDRFPSSLEDSTKIVYLSQIKDSKEEVIIEVFNNYLFFKS